MQQGAFRSSLGLAAPGPACLFRSIFYHWLLPVEFADEEVGCPAAAFAWGHQHRCSSEGCHSSADGMAERTVPHAHPMSVEYEFANPSKIYDQNFGEGIAPGDILAPTLYHGYYIRPRINKQLDRGTSEVNLNAHKFQAFLDVCHFTPNEISVRTVDNLLEVTAQHPQKADRHGFVSREFTRTYILPLDVDALLVKATLSHDGILSIEAPRTGKEVKAKIKEVKITCQEQPAGKEGSSEENAQP